MPDGLGLLAGPLAVKAAVLRAVELLGASGLSRLYEGPIDSTGRVRQRASTGPSCASQCRPSLTSLHESAWRFVEMI